MSNTALFTPPKPKYFSTEGALQFLQDYAGIRLSKSRFFVLTATGRIPSKKSPTGRLLIPIDELQSWVDGDHEGNAEKVEA
ncbi:MAG: hypothetical protein LAC69_04380 [Chlorobium sp.]|nr:hypothetical protein [Chlorobium sp.]